MYEYIIRELGNCAGRWEEVDGAEAALNNIAKAGWRLIAITPAKYGISGIFERERVETVAEAEPSKPKRKRKAT